MESKTPKFDKLLDDILEKIVPHERECAQKDISKYCEKKFKIIDEDIKFYKLLRVPPPKCCPTCRRQRRFAFNNRINLYKRKDDAPGAINDIVSYVPPVSPLTVYNLDYYRSAKWDPVFYAKNYDSNISFFDQFFDLRLMMPQYAIVRHPSSIDSEYSLNGRNLKNGYLVSGGSNSENIWYSIFLNNSKEIMASHDVSSCERCYETFLVKNLNTCAFCYFTNNSINSYFLFDCRNCQDCFCCVNLRNKKYCFFNKQLSKEEYEKRVEELKIYTRSGIKKTLEKFWQFVKSNPVRASRSVSAINSTGVLLINSKNCQDAHSCENAEHERHVTHVKDHKDSMDIYASGNSELLYEVSSVGANTSNVKFSQGSKNVSDCEFIVNCHNCSNCFACVGLENKSYYIFNKPYEPEAYSKELDNVKTSMLLRGEYGEFFPYKFSTFSYNGSEAELSYPLSIKEIERIGSIYQPDIEIDIGDIEVLKVEDVPDSIYDIDDNILGRAIICEKTGRPFKVIKSELEFYRKLKFPIPTIHPLERMKKTFNYLGNNLKYNGICKKCGIELETIYKESEGWEKLYCEKCYQQEVY